MKPRVRSGEGRRLRSRFAGFVALTAVSALISTGCSGGGGAGETSSATSTPDQVDFGAAPAGALSAWGFENADDVGKARLAYAERRLTDVEVELDATAFDPQRFTSRLADGIVPDVVQMDRRYVTQYAAQGLVMPLDSCFDAHGVDPDEYWYTSVVDDVRYQDRVWAVPQFYQPTAIILNETVMDAAGVTNDQIDTSRPEVLIAAIRRMYDETGGGPGVLGLDPLATGQAALWVLGQGGQLVDADGVPTLDDPRNAAGIRLLKRIVDAQGGFASVKSFTESFDTFSQNNQYVADQVGAQVNAQWYPNVLSPYVEELDIEAVPFRNAAGEPFSVAGGSAFVIPVGATNPAAGCAWMVELTGEAAWSAAGEAREATLEEDGGINTGVFTGSPGPDQTLREKYVVSSGDAGFDQVIATYYDVVDDGTTFGSSPAGQDIQIELNNAVTAALAGDKTITQALAEAQEAALSAYENARASG